MKLVVIRHEHLAGVNPQRFSRPRRSFVDRALDARVAGHDRTTRQVE